MPAIPPAKGGTGRWEGIRTIVPVIGIVLALVTAVAGGVGFIAGHFATEADMKAVKQFQGDIAVCIEAYALPKINYIEEQLFQYSQYLNDKASVLSLREDNTLWWLIEEKKERGLEDATDEKTVEAFYRTMSERWGSVMTLQDIIVDLTDKYEEHCNKVAIRRAQWRGLQ